MDNEIYFSMTELPSGFNEDNYIWAVWDIYPSSDLGRPPILSGTVKTLGQAREKADSYCLKFSLDLYSDHLKSIIRWKGKIISYFKRKDDAYFFAAWESELHYLCGMEPVIQIDNINYNTLQENILEWGNGNPYAGSNSGGYARNYIRKREAIRKLSDTKEKSSGEVSIVEFLYTTRNHHINRKKIWLRHRIIKKTSKYIFIDKFPYCGKSFVIQGWQAFVTYTIEIDRIEIEESGCFYHAQLRRSFCSQKASTKSCKDYFNKDNQYNDLIVEIPRNSLQWATKLLEINDWPVSQEIVKKSFVKQSFKHHPDKGGDTKMFIQCKAARDFLYSMFDSSYNDDD